jgi:hypothetical protein
MARKKVGSFAIFVGYCISFSMRHYKENVNRFFMLSASLALPRPRVDVGHR